MLEVTHSDWKLAEFTSLCRLLCCRFLVYGTQLNIDTRVVYETLWEIFSLFLALAISDWLLPRSLLHLKACWLPAIRIEIHYNSVLNRNIILNLTAVTLVKNKHRRTKEDDEGLISMQKKVTICRVKVILLTPCFVENQ